MIGFRVKPWSQESEGANWLDRAADVKRYVVSVSVNWSFPQPGRLDLLPAGRQNTSYSVRVNTFSWRDFYERLNGGAFFELVKEKVTREYDFILVDSRTGVSDTSGICTVQMPDRLVVCFTGSEQNIRGSASVAAAVKAHWTRLDNTPDAGYKRRIFPIFTRIEHTEKEKLDAARAHVRKLYRPILSLDPEAEESYWNRAEVSYWPYYAFEEVLAVFADEFRTDASLLAACETVTDLISDGAVAQFTRPPSPDRERVLRAFSRAFAEMPAGTDADALQQQVSLEVDTGEYAFKSGPEQLRIFLSSAGDVADERGLARRLIKDELMNEPLLRGRFFLDLVSWDDPDASLPTLGSITPQEAVRRFGPKPSECDVFVLVLWSRLGTQVDVSAFHKPDGERYLTGTEWEFDDALTWIMREGWRM